MKFIFFSEDTFEKWSYENPDTVGIGGSETSHIEMARRLAARGHEVISYAPTPFGERLHEGVMWRDCRQACFEERADVWMVYRAPAVIDRLPAGQAAWLICQDTDYRARGRELTGQRAARFQRIVALCGAHKAGLARCGENVCVSSNGIKAELISELLQNPPARNPKRLMYASSPDRGMEFLLSIFPKAREIAGDSLELHIFYGFDNIDKVVSGLSASHWISENTARLKALVSQPGVVWHGRTPQPQLLREWFKSGIWCHPSNFTETSPVHGDTLIETLSGSIPIKDLVGQTRLVYSCGSDGGLSISTARNVKCTRRDAPVIKLTFTPGRGRNAKRRVSLILTPDHEVMLSNGMYAQAGSLRAGDKVKAFHRQQGGWGLGYATVGLTSGHLIPEHRFVYESFFEPLAGNQVVDHLDRNTKNNEPSNLQAKTQGRHALDHWRRDHKSRDKKFAAFMAYSLEKGERKAAAAKKAWDSLTTEQKKNRIAKSHTSGANAKRAVQSKRLANPEKMRKASLARWVKQRALSNHTLIEVQSAGIADVYCMEVDPDHNFIANHIVVHNCITCMEAQACGAVPVTGPVWAIAENVGYGVFIEGDVSTPLIQARYALEVVKMALDPARQEAIRAEMMPFALETFDWENFVSQWEGWAAFDRASGTAQEACA